MFTKTADMVYLSILGASAVTFTYIATEAAVTGNRLASVLAVAVLVGGVAIVRDIARRD